MSEYVDVAIIENGKVIGSFKALHKTEEKKDEMKNRISMALKDPILQQGFEIICKENAELKNKIEHRNCLDCSNHHSNIKLLKAKEIIALGLRVCETSSIEYMNLYQKQAEQFIKEIEK